MDDYGHALGTNSDGTSPDGGRPSLGKAGMLALALVPLVAAMAVVGVVLTRAAGGAPAAAPRAEGTTLGPYPVIRYPSAPPPTTGPAASATPAPSAGDGGPGSPGSPGGGGTGTGGGTGGGGSGGGGGAGGSGGGGGGPGIGGGGATTTTRPPPPPPPPPAPSITGLGCTGGRIRFNCTVSYQAPGAVQIRWTRDSQPVPAWDNYTTVNGSCVAGSFVEVSVTVSNPSGNASDYGYVECPEPPCPKICPRPPLAPPGADAPSARRH